MPPTDGAAAQVIAVIDVALDAVTQLDADLGMKQKLLEEVDVTLQEEIDLTREFVGAVNDADIAELVARISQEEVALEASFTITGELPASASSTSISGPAPRLKSPGAALVYL